MTPNEWRKLLPEYNWVCAELASPRGYMLQPLKFAHAIEIVVCPAEFTPSAQGDFAFTSSYHWNGKYLTRGIGYSYDTMLGSRVNPYTRTVDVPPGHRVWICTYDGQWGGRWSRVLVFCHPEDRAAHLLRSAISG